MIPGMYPRMVRMMLMRKSALHPRSRKTPTGGRKMARMICGLLIKSAYDEIQRPTDLADVRRGKGHFDGGESWVEVRFVCGLKVSSW